MLQVEREEVELVLHPADDADRLAEVGLRMTGLMRQRHEHLLRRCRQPAIVLHDRDAARAALLVPEPIEDSLGRKPLLLRPTSVLRQDGV